MKQIKKNLMTVQGERHKWNGI